MNLNCQLLLTDPIDPFFFSVEIQFDSKSLDFVDIGFGDLTEGGVKIASLLSENRVGASVSRTSAYGTVTSGELMVIKFRVKKYTSAGTHFIEFSNQQLVTSADETIESEEISLVQYQVEETLVSVELLADALTEVTEGENVEMAARILATGVSHDETQAERVSVWLGISDSDTDPADWEEELWHAMDFSDVVDQYFIYRGEAAYKRPVGNYYLAVRSILNSESIYRYGGIHGDWDQDSAVLSILDKPHYRYTLAGWDFNDDSLEPALTIPQNGNASIQTVGANQPTFVNNGSGRAASASGWHLYDQQNPAHWLVQLSTENFESIWLQSDHSGTNTGPRDFCSRSVMMEQTGRL
jgi:hypothetical protein